MCQTAEQNRKCSLDNPTCSLALSEGVAHKDVLSVWSVWGEGVRTVTQKGTRQSLRPFLSFSRVRLLWQEEGGSANHLLFPLWWLCLLACCVTRTVNSPCSVLGKSRHRCHMKDAPLCTNHNMGYCDKYCNVGKRRHALSHGRCHWHQGTSNNLHKAAKCLWLRWNSPFFSGLFAYLPIRVSDLRVILKHLLLTIWPLRGLLM